ncbi:MAG: hypothetical protein O9254_01475 [Rhodobacteraceae bacterium]|nr:hypothetical protein [Paracoccaceae bacterium]
MDRPQHDILIRPDADLSALKGTCLFYPCSGADLLTPMVLFADKVAALCFADRGYFRPRHQDTRHHGLDIAVTEADPIPAPQDEWAFRYRTVEEASAPEDDDFDLYSRHLGVARLTETYHHNTANAEFRVQRSNDDARRVFDSLTDPLGVFFYRGDSLGEGGSGILWNDMPLMERVLHKLVNGGLLVTDGSNAGDATRYGVIQHRPVMQGREMRTAEQGLDWVGFSFKSLFDRRLTCIGYAGQRYGATLIWQVDRI